MLVSILSIRGPMPSTAPIRAGSSTPGTAARASLSQAAPEPGAGVLEQGRGALQKGPGGRPPAARDAWEGLGLQPGAQASRGPHLLLLHVSLPLGVSRTRIPTNGAGMEHRAASPTRTLGNGVIML